MFSGVREVSEIQALENLIASCCLCAHLSSPLLSQAPGVHDPHQDGQLPPKNSSYMQVSVAVGEKEFHLASADLK